MERFDNIRGALYPNVIPTMNDISTPFKASYPAFESLQKVHGPSVIPRAASLVKSVEALNTNKRTDPIELPRQLLQ